jgi:hypothetical protein
MNGKVTESSESSLVGKLISEIFHPCLLLPEIIELNKYFIRKFCNNKTPTTKTSSLLYYANS